MRFQIIIANSGHVVDESDDRTEALRMADSRTYMDRLLHTISDTNPPDMGVLAAIFEG